MNNLAHFCDAMLPWITTYLIHSTILLTGCLLISLLIRSSSHAFAERSWKFAAIAGILTTIIQIGLVDSIWPRNEVVQIARIANPIVRGNADLTDAGESPQSPPLTVAETDWGDVVWTVRMYVAPIAAAQVPVRIATPSGKFRESAIIQSAAQVNSLNAASRWHILLKIGLVVCAVSWTMFGVIRLCVCSLLLHQRVRHMPILSTGRARVTLDKLIKQAGVTRSVELRIDSRESAPIALGMFRPTIVLPAECDQICGEGGLSDTELRAALSHELAHLVRRDVYWLWIGQVLTSCLGFQPLNFLAHRVWRRSAEFLCDQWAVSRGVRRLDMAKCLTTLAERGLQRTPSSLVLAATGAKATLCRRVERLVSRDELTDRWQEKSNTRLLQCVATLLVFLMLLLAPGVSTSANENQVVAESVSQKALDNIPLHTVTIHMDGNITVSQIEARVRLDLELKALSEELDQAANLAAQLNDSSELQTQIEQLHEAKASFENRRMRFTDHLFQEN